MSKSKQLAALTLAVVTLAGTSAFAESRHSNETRSRGEARSTVRRERSAPRAEARAEGRRGDNSRNGASERRREGREGREGRTVERRREGRAPEGRTTERRAEGRTNERRREGRTYERRDGDRNRSGRSEGSYRGGSQSHRGGSRYGNRQPYYASGRVSRHQRYGGGYRVWIHGAPYPFYVPLAYWHHDRFRVGLSIRLGGYYNSLGYYDYWDGYRDGSYNSGYRAHSAADFRGVVESVDYRRDSFVVRNDDTGNFITVVLRDRRETLPRAGDYVAVRGDWTTRGYFRAYDVDFLDNDRYERY